MPQQAKAENTRNNYDKNVQEYIRACNIKIKDREVLKMADTLFDIGRLQNNVKVQCIALCIKVNHFSLYQDESNIFIHLAKAKEFIRKTQYLEYYYFAWSCLVNAYIRQDKFIQAVQELEQVKQEAIKDKNKYGLAMCYRLLGHSYYARGNFRVSSHFYTLSLEIDNDVRNKYNSLSTLGESYFKSFKYDKARHYYNEIINSQADERMKASSNASLCILAFYEQKFDEARAYYNIVRNKHDLILASGALGFTKSYEVKSIGAALEGDLDKAMKYVDSIKVNRSNRVQLKISLLVMKGDYKAAYDSIRVLHSFINTVRDLYDFESISVIDAQLTSSVLINAKQKLLIEKSVGDLRIKQQEQSLFELKGEQRRIALNSTLLKSQNQKLELEKNMAQIRTKEMELKIKSQAVEQQKVLIHFLVLIGISSVIGLLVSIFLAIRENHLKHSIEEQRDIAQSAEKLKMAFVQNMSHEVRTPLNAIVGFADVLVSDDELTTEEKVSYSSAITHNSDLITTLVNDILDISTLQSGHYRVEWGKVSADGVCINSIDSIRHRIPEQIDFKYIKPQTDVPIYITSDGRRIQQVLINFLTNAIKYTKEGSITLSYALSRKKNYIIFSVADTGCGIPKDKADLVFNRFEMLQTKVAGHGLGLNICAIIAKNLRGRVYVDKEYTKGARFCLELPL